MIIVSLLSLVCATGQENAPFSKHQEFRGSTGTVLGTRQPNEVPWGVQLLSHLFNKGTALLPALPELKLSKETIAIGEKEMYGGGLK